MDQLCDVVVVEQQKEGNEIMSQLQDRVAMAFGRLVPVSDQAKSNQAAVFLDKIKIRFQNKPSVYKQLLTILQNYQQRLPTHSDVQVLFSTDAEILEELKKFLPESEKRVEPITQRSRNLQKIQQGLKAIAPENTNTKSIRIENCIGFTQVPLGIAGPLHIKGKNQNKTVYAPLATVEPTLVAACSRGCKAFQAASGGIQAAALSEGMSRGPVFNFRTVDDAVRFYQHVPSLEPVFRASAEGTSRYARLVSIVPHIIGRMVHVKFIYSCGDATGQNMVTLGTHRACQEWMKSEAAKPFGVVDFQLEGQFASDKKLSWGSVHSPRGVRVLAWGRLDNETCLRILGCSSRRFHRAHMKMNEGGVRNGHMGQCLNTANVMAAMFIACGQDVASVLESGWSQLTIEIDDNEELTLSLYFPSVAVGTVGGGTQYPTQREALELIDCLGSGKKHALAETVAAFALALEVSTLAALANDTFAQSHADLARSEAPRSRL